MNGEEDKYETISHTLTKKFEFSDDIELSPRIKGFNKSFIRNKS